MAPRGSQADGLQERAMGKSLWCQDPSAVELKPTLTARVMLELAVNVPAHLPIHACTMHWTKSQVSLLETCIVATGWENLGAPSNPFLLNPKWEKLNQQGWGIDFAKWTFLFESHKGPRLAVSRCSAAQEAKTMLAPCGGSVAHASTCKMKMFSLTMSFDSVTTTCAASPSSRGDWEHSPCASPLRNGCQHVAFSAYCKALTILLPNPCEK